MKIEICVDRVSSGVIAEKAGATRLELCQDLSIGGTTPSFGLVKETLENVNIPVVLMIRPRAGDFCYDDYEFSCMLNDIELFKELNIEGFVIGILKADGSIDAKRMKLAIESAPNKDFIFHRAFDMSNNLDNSLEISKELGIKRILTGGGKQRAIDGIGVLEKLTKKSEDVIIMAGSGINLDNISKFKEINISEIHLSGKHFTQSKMQFRKKNISMGSVSKESEYLIEEASLEKIVKIVKAINS
ncbi:copper homeostasis protein CutC [Helicovermis profundi]|uniref:PF03932 family protein CutC n=1 Tax=Helicovermis profundi TaxID=3065157 RepID=A0AAU9E4X3_9FIRM|nr:copper homeostasis protein CutC [Clostridia bacterium S502]